MKLYSNPDINKNKERLRLIFFFLALGGFISLVDGKFESNALPLLVIAGIVVFAYGIFRYRTARQSKLAKLQPEKLKNKEKLKRGKYYQVGDDGELEEVEDEILRLEAKPKNSLHQD